MKNFISKVDSSFGRKGTAKLALPVEASMRKDQLDNTLYGTRTARVPESQENFEASQKEQEYIDYFEAKLP